MIIQEGGIKAYVEPGRIEIQSATTGTSCVLFEWRHFHRNEKMASEEVEAVRRVVFLLNEHLQNVKD